MKFANQVRIRLISKLIKYTTSILQKLRKYFNDTAFSTFFVPPLSVSSVIFCLKSNDSESLAPLNLAILPSFTAGSSLQYCQMFLKTYHYILLNYTSTLLHQHL